VEKKEKAHDVLHAVHRRRCKIIEIGFFDWSDDDYVDVFIDPVGKPMIPRFICIDLCRWTPKENNA
jgi:hypothetical protein